jgi:hypothetical protein
VDRQEKTVTGAAKKQVYWTGDVPAEDDFGVPISHTVGSAFVDGKTRHGPWGFMSVSSYALEGCGLGVGLGQKYVMQADGRWLKVGG